MDKSYLSVALASLAVAISLVRSPSQDAPGEVTATRFVLVNAEGKELGEIASEDGRAFMRLTRPDGYAVRLEAIGAAFGYPGNLDEPTEEPSASGPEMFLGVLPEEEAIYASLTMGSGYGSNRAVVTLSPYDYSVEIGGGEVEPVIRLNGKRPEPDTDED